jgi:hypothetical protein
MKQSVNHTFYPSPLSLKFLAYATLAFTILSVDLNYGYVLTLDMIFTPKLSAPNQPSNNYYWQKLLHLINFILSGQIIEKIMVFNILFLCGYSIHRLIDTKSEWPKYFAGIIYTINPFTYERWMAGQYLILAGYSLLPFLVKSLLTFVRSPSRKTSLLLCIWYVAMAVLSVQMLILAAILGLLIVAVHVSSIHNKIYFRRIVFYSSVLVLSFFLFNIYWLIGVFRGTSPISQTIGAITSNDLTAFTTASNPHLGLFFNVLTMYGFWEERFHRYVMPNANIGLWLGLFSILAVLIVLGIRARWHTDRETAIVFLITGAIGFVMACGIEAPLTGLLVKWVITSLPLMKGFREPEKFSILLVFSYVYFASYGVDFLYSHFHNWSIRQRELLMCCLILVPLIYVSTMLFGFGGQLTPVNYPASWYGFDSYLSAHPASGKLLFLPWNEYMSYDFSPRIIANPAPQFFYQAPVIAGTDAQFGTVYQSTATPTALFIENQILKKAYQTDLGLSLAKIHVQYVLLANGYDYSQYGFLNHQTDLRVLSSKPGLTVYLNEAYKRT